MNRDRVPGPPDLYEPPGPDPLPPLAALVRTALRGEGNLLSLLPASAYEVPFGPLGYSRRFILIVNDPEHIRAILADPEDVFPKSDLMVGALEPLVGDSIFVSAGDRWRAQRRMVDPAFSHMRLSIAFPAMSAAIDDMEARLDERCRTGEAFSLDLMLGQLTADIICRTVFSASLANDTARDVFESFSVFERSVAHVELRRLIFDKAFTAIPQSRPVLDACDRIRRHIGVLLDRHLAAGATFDDIAASIIGARDPQGGATFTREELIDQLGVFFLAGHETTASALTWAVFIAAMRPEVADRMQAEVGQGAPDAPITFEQTRHLTFARNVFRETLRLYPPITFLPRVALKPVKFGRYQLRRGSMVMIAPWVVHRHSRLWKNPHAFDPDRFLPEREHEMTPGAYIPFGIGRRVCVGAAFATTEATLILGRLMRRYRFTVERPERVRPVARLTTRPAEEVMVRISRVGSTA